MIKSKKPSQHTTPHTGGTTRASAVARRHCAGARAPRDNHHRLHLEQKNHRETGGRKEKRKPTNRTLQREQKQKNRKGKNKEREGSKFTQRLSLRAKSLQKQVSFCFPYLAILITL
jgi:hypothetical protein